MVVVLLVHTPCFHSYPEASRHSRRHISSTVEGFLARSLLSLPTDLLACGRGIGPLGLSLGTDLDRHGARRASKGQCVPFHLLSAFSSPRSQGLCLWSRPLHSVQHNAAMFSLARAARKSPAMMRTTGLLRTVQHSSPV